MTDTPSSASAPPLVHVADWLEDYVAGRLESPRREQIEAHLLACDACFAAYVALLLRKG